MITPEELGKALEQLGFQKGKAGAGPDAPEGYLWRADRVLVAVTRTALENFVQPPHQDETKAPWPVFIRIELRFLHAADILKKNGVPVSPVKFEQYLTSLGRMGLFPDRVHGFYDFEKPEHLDLAMTVNMQAVAEDFTADIFQERLAPILEALRHAEIYMVFGAVLDALRYELEQKALAGG